MENHYFRLTHWAKEMPVLLHITSLDVVEPFILDITFSDGETRMVDVRPLLRGPTFQPLLDPVMFRTASIDPIAKTVCWPCGVDFAPDAGGSRAFRLEPFLACLLQADGRSSRAAPNILRPTCSESYCRYSDSR